MVNMEKKITPILFGIYCASLMVQNILATKTFDFFVFTVTTGILISPLVFIIQDVASEILGYKKTKQMIILSFVMNFIAVILFQIAIFIPASTTYANQEAFAIILSSTPRITFASLLAYVSGSLINSKIMIELREKYNKSLFVRAITSTIVGQLVDNGIFSIVAFLFVLPTQAVLSMIIGGTLFEVVYEILFYPLTKTIIKRLKVGD
jgi:uncharacterized integral membrane protein (TIGR00697 family)